MNTRRTIIYYHQALPLFPFKFSLFGSNVKEYLFYCYIYPLYVKLFLGKQTYVALQTADIKQRFARRYRFPEERIDVFSLKQIELTRKALHHINMRMVRITLCIHR